MHDPKDAAAFENDISAECDLVFNSNESIGDENEPHVLQQQL